MVEEIKSPGNSEERFKEEIVHLRDLMARAGELYVAQFGNSLGLGFEKGELAKRLEGKPNSNLYQAFHVLAGSSQAKDCRDFDFSGEDSIVTFFEKLIQELEQMENRPADSKLGRSEKERILRQRQAEEKAILEKVRNNFPDVDETQITELLEIKQNAAAYKIMPRLLSALAQFEKNNPEANKFLAFIIVSQNIQTILDSSPDQFDYPDNRILNFLKNWRGEMAKKASPEDIAQKFGLALEYIQEPTRIMQAAVAANKSSEFQLAMVQFAMTHPDTHDYIAFHLSMGRGVRISDLDLLKFDYPGGDIIKYVKDWEEKNLKV